MSIYNIITRLNKIVQCSNVIFPRHFTTIINKHPKYLLANHIHNGIILHINNNPLHFIQMFGFSGRKGGLKRKKSNKLDVRVQTSLGRRMEFYHPIKKKRKRIRLIQNSRGNLVYDSIIKRFLVVYYKQGMQVFRPFSSRKNKFEFARTKSIALARQLAEKYYKFNHHSGDDGVNINKNNNIINLDEYLQPDVSTSGVRGVFFDSEDKSWVVHFNEAGVRKYRKFNIDSLGFQNAYTSAISFKRFKLLQYHQFLPMRQRYRRGRKYLR